MAKKTTENLFSDPVVAGLRAGERKAAVLLHESLDAIDARNGSLNAYLSVARESAMARAAEIDAMEAGERGGLRLAGLPCGVKDVLVVEGMQATASSKILEGYQPPYGDGGAKADGRGRGDRGEAELR